LKIGCGCGIRGRLELDGLELDLLENIMTSIGFGGGEVVQVDLPLDEVRDMLQNALTKRQVLTVQAQNGETVVINPEQVKVLQNSAGGPEQFPPETDLANSA
jgi:hypothetical protein